MVEVYKILNNIDTIENDRLFTMATYSSTRGHPQKLLNKKDQIGTLERTTLVIEWWKNGTIYLNMWLWHPP